MLKSTVDRRAEVLNMNIFVEVDGGNGTLGNSLWSELELL
jgi:hypothetical protein